MSQVNEIRTDVEIITIEEAIAEIEADQDEQGFETLADAVAFYASEDLTIAEERGEMSIGQTVFGRVDVEHNNGRFTIRHSGAVQYRGITREQALNVVPTFYDVTE